MGRNHVNRSQATFSMTSVIDQNLIPRKKSLSPRKPKNTLTYQNLILPKGEKITNLWRGVTNC